MDIPLRVDNVVLRTADLMRVANLRRRIWSPEAAEHLAAEMTKSLRTPYGQMQLRPIQAVALYELATEGGLFAPMGTGQGKTLTSLLAPVILQRTRGVGNRPLLIVPAGLVEKTERDAKALADHWQLARFYKIMSYEFLGRVQAGANERTGYKGALEEFDPDLVFLDECFPYETRVLTDQGEQSIGDIVCFGVGHSVLSRAACGTVEWKRIVRRLRRPEQPLVKVVHEHGEFVCTSNHQIWTERGYVDAGLLSKEDYLYSLRDPSQQGLQVLLQGVSPCTQVEIFGSSQNPDTRSSRVVRVEILERAGVERLGGCSSGDRELFDLEVEDNHNYFAEGVLVSNCHRAKNRRTASVARRLHRFLAAHQHVICAAASGTFTNRSILEYAHILRWCHPPQHVPLPLHWNELEAWARALDERQSEPGEPGALEILCNAEEQALWKTDRHTAARLAYRRRLVDTPGVVATKDSSVGATLIIRSVQPKLSKTIDEGFDILRTWETPDGWPIDDGISMARHARELAAGFYYVWRPRPPHEWLSARKTWSKYVRDTLKHSRKMDTELQVRQHEHLREKEKPGSMCEALANWIKVKDTFEPNTVPVWVCNSVLEFAHDWAQKHRGIIWNEHVCFGERLEKEGGVPYYGRKGKDARGKFIDDHPAEQSLVASVASNKEGRNLQKWSENLVLGWPSSGSICEQMIARTHRPGQEADEVTFDMVVSCIEHLGAFEQSRRDANYIQASTGNEQKLNLATIDVSPTLIGMGSRWTK